MEIQEMFERMRSGEIQAHSELGTRDEAKQMRLFTSRIQKMRTVTGIKAHALVMKDVVLPFNPFTCESDDVYNENNKFRPILLVEQTLSIIKKACAADQELAEKWNRRLGVSLNWETAPTIDDYYAFKAADFIKPRVTTYHTVTLSFNGQGGFSEFAQTFTVDPSLLDAHGNYLPGQNPIYHQGAVFFNSMLRPEAEDRVKALEKSGATKEAIQAERRAVYAKSPVGFVRPTNLIPFVFIPMGVAPKQFKPEQYTEFESYIRYYKYDPSKWNTAVQEATDDNTFDENMNFFDFTIRTPDSSSQKSNGQVYTDDDTFEIYTAMTIANTDARSGIWTGKSTIDGVVQENSKLYAGLFEAAAAYFAHSQDPEVIKSGESFEALMAASNRFRPIDTVMDKFLPACHQVFLNNFADSKYFTPERKKANAAFFTAMNPDNALALADTDEDELEAAAAEQASSIGDLIAAANAGLGDDATPSVEELRLSDE